MAFWLALVVSLAGTPGFAKNIALALAFTFVTIVALILSFALVRSLTLLAFALALKKVDLI